MKESLRKSPRLDKIDPLELGQECSNLATWHLVNFGLDPAKSASLAKKIGGVVLSAVRYAQTGNPYPVGFESVCRLLTSTALEQQTELPTDPDRLQDDTIGRLALVRIAFLGRCALGSWEALTAAQLAALTSLSVRTVRDVLACHRSEDGTYRNSTALEFLKAHEVKL